jgi:hypothetical protein
VSGPLHEGAVHLTVLDDSVAEGYRFRAVLAASELPSCSWCPDGCDCDPTYCSECVRAAASWNAEVARER